MSVEPRRLEEECRLCTRYLIGCDPDAAIVSLYVAASESLFGGDGRDQGQAEIDWVTARPWSIGFVDAAAGVRNPQGLLRSKLLMLTALLETSPVYVDHFLAREMSIVMLAGRGLAIGIKSVVRLVVGLALYSFVPARA